MNARYSLGHGPRARWGGEAGLDGEAGPDKADTRTGGERPSGGHCRNGTCPVLTAAQKDCILEIVVGHMDRYSRGDGGDEL